MPTEYQARFDCEELLGLESNGMKITSDGHMGLNNDEQVTFSWEIPYGAEQECIDWLYENRVTISDFDTPFRHFDGLYRTVTIEAQQVKRDGRIIGSIISHKMAKGLYTEVSYAAARMEQIRRTGTNTVDSGLPNGASDSDAKDVAVFFPYCHPGHIDSMVASLNMTTIPSIVIRGETIAGPWHLISVTTRKEDDGTHTIIAQYSKSSYVLKSYQDYQAPKGQTVIYLWRIPKDQAQGIADAWKTEAGLGAAATFGYNEEQGLVDIVLRKRSYDDQIQVDLGTTGLSCSYSETSIFYFNVADPNSIDISGYATTAGLSYRKMVDKNQDGTYDVTIVIRNRTQQGPLEFISEKQAYRSVISRETLGWLDGLAAYNAEYPIEYPEIGQTISRDVSINEDCSLDIIDRTLFQDELSGYSIKKTILETESVETSKSNEDNGLVDPVPSREPVQGEVVTFSRKHNPDGTWNKSERVDVSPVLDGERVVYRGTKGLAAQTSIDKNLRGSEPTPSTTSPTAGVTVSFEATKNPDGTFDATETIENAPELDKKSIRKTILASSESAGGRNLVEDAEPEPSREPVQGETLYFDRQENPDGTWDKDERFDVSPVMETYESIATIKSESIGSGIVNKRYPIPTPSAPSIGKTVRFNRRRNEDGTWTYTELIEDSSVESLGARVYEVTACRGVENEAEIERNIAQDLSDYDAESPPKGVIRTVRLTENRDGSWDREIQDRSAPSLESTEIVSRRKGGVVVTITRNNTGTKPSEPSNPAVGVTTTQRVDDNADCSFDVTVREETAPNLEIEKKIFSADEDIAIIAAKNAAAKITVSAVSGKVISGTNSENPDGSWDTELETRTPTEVWTEWIPYTDKYGTSYTCTFKNFSKAKIESLITSTMTAATNNSIGASRNQYGLYDGSASKIAAESSSGSSSIERSYDSTYYVNYRGAIYEIHELVTNSEVDARSIIENTPSNGWSIIDGYKAEIKPLKGSRKFYVMTVTAYSSGGTGEM